MSRWSLRILASMMSFGMFLMLEGLSYSVYANEVPQTVVSVFQAPDGYVQELESLGRGQIQFSHKGQDWASFFAGDIWIFFISGKGELTQLPEGVLQALRSPEASWLREQKVLEAQTNLSIILNNSRDVRIKIFNMSWYRKSSRAEVVCETASSTFSDIIKESQRAFQARLAKCKGD